jgi:pimeloyl-ACP methyl ester carboxylesterase
MNKAQKGYVRQHVRTFQYSGKSITFQFWSHLHEGTAPDTIIFLGTGQSGRIAQWAAKASPSGIVVVEGAPHWQAHPSAHDLYDFMYAYTLTAFRAVLNEFSIASAHLVAHSQAAPGVVGLGTTYPDEVRNIALIAPLGFAATIFGNTPEARVRTFMRRATRTLFQLSQSPLYDPRNMYAGFMILRAILKESERGASKRKYATGLAYDMREDCRSLVELQTKKGETVTLLLGDKDKMFTVKEIRSLIKAADIKDLHIHILPGVSHLSLGVRGGRKVVKAAADIVRHASAR